METVSPWRTSSYSGNGGQNCIETSNAPGAVLVRDTKNRDAGMLAFTLGAWMNFTASLK